ncbi:LLM class flavin-dependent oxidoreductase [Streptomyces sp. NPDC047987]|uniref:LLM class flavin-dependent oxidoreductase n=1 Tax=unclassified Streptomyces TaxID=2593676 RepID=UPI003440EF4A
MTRSQSRHEVLGACPHRPCPASAHPSPPLHRKAVRGGDRVRVVAQRPGFDAYAIGERHAGPFRSSSPSPSPSTVLGALAARASTLRLTTGVTVVAILDPVRMAEVFATPDQVTRSRTELAGSTGSRVRRSGRGSDAA